MTQHINPYARFNLDLETRLPIEEFVGGWLHECWGYPYWQIMLAGVPLKYRIILSENEV